MRKVLLRFCISITVMLLIACGSFKPQENFKIPSSEYTGPYYYLFEVFPEDSHVITMGGIGDTFDLDSLKQNNLNGFVESFYTQLAYCKLPLKPNCFKVE